MQNNSSILMSLAFITAMTVSGSARVMAEGEPTGDPAFIPPGSTLEKLVDGDKHDLVFAEGPVVTCDNQVMWSDITFSSAKPGMHGGLRAGNIMSFDPVSKAVAVFRSPSGMSNGLRIDLQCNLLAAEGADYGGRRVTRTDLKTGRAEVLTGLYDGRPYNAPNDIAIDSAGRIYFSDPRYLGHEPVDQATMAVYRVDPDLSVHRVITDVGKPNGVAICPDEAHIFVASNDNGAVDFQRLGEGEGTTKGAMSLLRYDLAEDGSASNRTVLVDYLPEDGPDGLICDSEGNLWVAVRDATRPGIYAYTPDGEEKGYIPTTIPTNVHFGRGENSDYLYITADNSLYGMRVGKKGHHLQ